MPKRPSAFEAWGYQSTQTAPSPNKTSAKAPMNSAVSFCPRLYIKEPPGRGTSRVRSDRDGFYLEREEKRQPIHRRWWPSLQSTISGHVGTLTFGVFLFPPLTFTFTRSLTASST